MGLTRLLFCGLCVNERQACATFTALRMWGMCQLWAMTFQKLITQVVFRVVLCSFTSGFRQLTMPYADVLNKVAQEWSHKLMKSMRPVAGLLFRSLHPVTFSCTA